MWSIFVVLLTCVSLSSGCMCRQYQNLFPVGSRSSRISIILWRARLWMGPEGKIDRHLTTFQEMLLLCEPCLTKSRIFRNLRTAIFYPPKKTSEAILKWKKLVLVMKCCQIMAGKLWVMFSWNQGEKVLWNDTTMSVGFSLDKFSSASSVFL